MSYPWNFETTADVSIDADDILEYVKNNKDWFLEKINDKPSTDETVKELINYLRNILDEFDCVRRCRDKAANNRDLHGVKLYEAVEEVKNKLETLL